MDVATPKLLHSALSVALEGSLRQLDLAEALVGASAVDSVIGLEEDSEVEGEEASVVAIEVDLVEDVEVLGTKVEEVSAAAVAAEVEVGMGAGLTAMVLPPMHLPDLAAVEASVVGVLGAPMVA